ncbi:unnamed protein product [Nezara viridula]|uniref:Uncharacterized protein n=1 Tax=Nezara viridula TaxID=85310 RepID=A0A9P0GX40_NEZVI|nr:unnamed protein product [Nezara viridula]
MHHALDIYSGKQQDVNNVILNRHTEEEGEISSLFKIQEETCCYFFITCIYCMNENF